MIDDIIRLFLRGYCLKLILKVWLCIIVNSVGVICVLVTWKLSKQFEVDIFELCFLACLIGIIPLYTRSFLSLKICFLACWTRVTWRLPSYIILSLPWSKYNACQHGIDLGILVAMYCWIVLLLLVHVGRRNSIFSIWTATGKFGMPWWMLWLQ